ncbi:hypothetical protein EDB85DRAFT_1892571 [Lactarius pseudohatsudake]|nr:hypothetical protein EDB85DRAFT_1892571 [Lactarius pseudohatsudake]
MTRRQRENEEEEDPYPQLVPQLAKRVNHGQGGAIAQLVSVSEKIRPDLESQSTNQSKRTKTPADASVNAMARSRLRSTSPERSPAFAGYPHTLAYTLTGGVSQGDRIGGDPQDDREVPPTEVRMVNNNTPSYNYEPRARRTSILYEPTCWQIDLHSHGHRVSHVLRPEDTVDDGASDEDGGSQSVLQSHQQKNKAIRPPNPNALLATNKRVPSQVPRQTNAGRPLDTPMCVANPRDNHGHHSLAPDNSGCHSLAPNENNAEGSNRNVTPRAHSPCTFKPHEEAEPTHLRYYQGTPWYDVLINAKSLYRMEIHTETSGPFPERN